MEKQQQTLAHKLGQLAYRFEFWILVIAIIATLSIWWHSAYLVMGFCLASIFAWMTHDATHPNRNDWL